MSPRRTTSEEGAVAVMTAVSLVAMVVVAGLVIDLGLVRVDVRRSQTGADTAVTAGAIELGSGDFVAACQEAWKYFTASVSGTAAPDNPACDALFGSAFGSCESRATSNADPSTSTSGSGPVVLEAPYGDYTLRMQMPVRHASDPGVTYGTDEILGAQTYDADFDGSVPCRRLGLQVLRERDFILGGVSGLLTGTSNVDAVARALVGEGEPEYATLIVLEQDRCPALTTDGQGSVVVQNEYESDSPTSDLEAEGIIHIDSAATTACGGGSGNGRLVHPGNSANSAICSGVDYRSGAVTSIILNADCGTVLPETLRTMGATNLALAQFVDGASDHQLESDPVSVGKRLTRGLVDHRFNCLTANPDDSTSANYPTSAPQYPASGQTEPVALCEDTVRGPHIDQLVAGTMTGSPPPGFTMIDDCGRTTPVDIRYVYVNCDQMPKVAFTSDIVVLKGSNRTSDGVNVGTGESVSIAPHTAGSSILVVRQGNVTVQGGGSLLLADTFVYLHDGDVKVTGGENVTWLAPDSVGYVEDASTRVVTPQNCAVITTGGLNVPDPSCFQHLALWSNDSAEHSFAGNGAVSVRGVFFTPNAHFNLSGSGNAGADSPLRLEDAQFFTKTLGISGGAGVLMKPNKDIFIQTPAYSVALMR